MPANLEMKTAFPMQVKCLFCWGGGEKKIPRYEGYIVGFIESAPYEYMYCTGSPPLHSNAYALVLAATFSRGEILTLPLYQVEVVEQWPGEDE